MNLHIYTISTVSELRRRFERLVRLESKSIKDNNFRGALISISSLLSDIEASFEHWKSLKGSSISDELAKEKTIEAFEQLRGEVLFYNLIHGDQTCQELRERFMAAQSDKNIDENDRSFFIEQVLYSLCHKSLECWLVSRPATDEDGAVREMNVVGIQRLIEEVEEYLGWRTPVTAARQTPHEEAAPGRSVEIIAPVSAVDESVPITPASPPFIGKSMVQWKAYADHLYDIGQYEREKNIRIYIDSHGNRLSNPEICKKHELKRDEYVSRAVKWVEDNCHRDHTGAELHPLPTPPHKVRNRGGRRS